MEIHYLSFSKIPSRDANSVHVMHMCEALAQQGHNVTLFAKKGEETNINPFTYYGVSNSFTLNLCLFKNIKIAGDVIYGLSAWRKILPLPAPDLYFGRHPHLLWLASFRNRPIIYDSHDVPQSWGRRKIESMVFRSKNFKRLTVTSDISKKEYLRIFPFLSPEKIIVARNGANITKGAPPLKTWPGRKNHLQVGYTGHLYPGRGMNIICALAERIPDADFHVVGGSKEDIKKWQKKNMPANIYLHGHVPHQKVPSYLQQFDIVLAPYQRKVTIGGGKRDTSKWMCPLKIFDYMAAQKAIIASNLSSLQEILQHDKNALLVDPEDIDAWVSAVKELQKNISKRNTLAEKAFRDIQEQYTWQKRAEKVLNNMPL